MEKVSQITLAFEPVLFVIVLIILPIIIFIVCAILDLIRQLIFKYIIISPLTKICNNIESVVNKLLNNILIRE